MTKKRFFRFSLTAIFVTITLLSAWLGYHAMKATQLRKLSGRVAELHGFIEYEDELDQRLSESRGAVDSNISKRSSDIIPKEWFASVGHISLVGNHINDESLRILEGYRGLRVLSVSATHITDEGLKIIGTLTDLESLGLLQTLITDQGLKELTQLKNLKELDLRLNGISDKGLSHLKELKSLRRLYLSHKNFTLDAIDELKQALPNCVIKDM